MGSSRDAGEKSARPVRITNRDGQSRYLLVCDHASNHIPAEYASLGLHAEDLTRHIAWDPGASAVCHQMAGMLDAALIESCISRLVVDCNRPLDAPDLIAATSETTAVPGNADVTPEEKARRVALAYEPYHAAIEELVSERVAAAHPTALVAVHSFNPTYAGAARPWQVGIVHDQDERLSRPLIETLSAIQDLNVGDNQPYSPTDRVYYTLERHARARGLPCVMIEIRNDEIANEAGQRRWGELLSGIFTDLEPGKGRQESRRQKIHHPVQPAN